MRNLFLCLAAIWLSACSIEGMAEKMLPDNVEARIESDLEAIMAKDGAVFETFYDESDKRTREDFDKQVNQALGNVASGGEIRRDIVGVQSNTSASIGEGRRSNYPVTYEIQTDQAFNLIELNYEKIGDEALTLTNANVQKFDASPMRAGLETVKKVGKAVLIAVIIFIAGLTTFLIRRSRRKRAERSA